MKKTELNEFYEILDRINEIQLLGLSDFRIGQVNSQMLYMHYMENRDTIQYKRDVVKRIIFRCFTKLYKVEIMGKAQTVFFVARNNSAFRKDHLENVRKAANLLKNRALVYGTVNEGHTLKRVYTLVLPVIWAVQLHKKIKSWLLCWQMSSNTYFDYIDYLEFKEYEKNYYPNAEGVVLLSETHPASQFVGQYYKNKGNTTVALMHSLMSKGNVERMLVYNSICDYIISYSEYATKMAELRLYDRYKKGIYELGMLQFINSKLEKRKITTVKRIGVFLDGMSGKSLHSNLKMIQIAIDSFQDKDVEIFVKCHPSATCEEIDFWKSNIVSERAVNFYTTEVLSLELEKSTDVMILRNTNCFMEGIYQCIPTFIFNMEPVDFKNIPEDIFFSSSEELSGQIKKISTGEMERVLDRLRVYLCGNDNPEFYYKSFFGDLGWE